MKSASLPGHAGDNDSFQPPEEPGGAALPSRRSAQHRGQQPLRPGPAAPPGRAARSGGAGSSLARPGGCAERSLLPGRAGGCRERTPARPAPLPAPRPLRVALHLKARRSLQRSQSPPGRGRSEPALTTSCSSWPRRRQGESREPCGSSRPSLAHLQRGSTARLETLANFYLQRTRLKIRPKPEQLQLSGFIQNSPHQLKSLKHLCRLYTPRLGHSERCRFHRESSKSSPPAVPLKQSAIFSLHVTVPSLRLLLECILGTGYREYLRSWGSRRLGLCFESRCLLRV